MSFILDALKKSEIDRQRQSVPGLMDAPTTVRRGPLPPWAMLLGCLLAINIVVLGIFLWRNGVPGAKAPARHTDMASADGKSAAVAEHFSPLAQTPVYAPEIPVPAAETPSSTGAAAAPEPQTIAPHAALHPWHRPDPVLIDDEDAKDNDELLPSINELNLTGAQALPELHLDVHVYATKPADRFVYINMHKYREGNKLQEGPVLERIRRDGVVLNYQGLRFLLPRQS